MNSFVAMGNIKLFLKENSFDVLYLSFLYQFVGSLLGMLAV